MISVAFDTETALISPRVKAPELVCTTWACNVPTPNQGIFRWDECYQHVRAWIMRPDVLLIGHNVAFDLAVLAVAFPDLLDAIFEKYAQGLVRDTMLREKLLDIARGEFRWRKGPDGSNVKVNYGLADLAKRHFDEVMAKGGDTWRLRYIEFRNVPLHFWPADALEYAIKDARKTLDVHDVQELTRGAILASHGVDLLVDQDRQCRAAFWIHLMSCWGLRIHPAKIAELAARLSAEYEDLREWMLEEGLVYRKEHRNGIPTFHRDTKAAKDRMLRVMWEQGAWAAEPGWVRPAGWDPASSLWSPNDWVWSPGTWAPRPCKMTAPSDTSPEGNVCLDEEACEDSDDPDGVLQAYAQMSALQNVLTKDVEAMAGGEIHGSFDSLVASGRTSCRGSKRDGGMNVQNLRRRGGTRECFVPRDGFVYCLIDLDTAELRAVAQLCIKMFGWSRMGELINAGRDVHCHLASESIGVAYETVLAGHQNDDPMLSAERQIHKNANFGLWGGMRERRFGALVRGGLKQEIAHEKDPAKKQLIRDRLALVTDEKIHFVREAWLRTWPESGPYLRHFEGLCKRGQTATVQQLFSGRWRGGLRYSEACNTGFQGLIADLMKEAGWEVSRAMHDSTRRSVLYGSHIANFPHDELICEVPEPIAHECANEIERIVLDVGERWLPDVPAKGKAYLARYWSKKAFPLYDVNKRRVPWNGEKKAA